MKSLAKLTFIEDRKMVKDEILTYAVDQVKKWSNAVCIASNEEARDIAIRCRGKALKHYEMTAKLVGENPLMSL